MKGKFITTSLLLACLSKRPQQTNDIHAQLKQTIAVHKKIMSEWDDLFRTDGEIVNMFDLKAA
jgi:hypothetical protein